MARAVFAVLLMLAMVSGIASAAEPEDARPFSPKQSQADMSRLRSAGYAAPLTSLEDGVADYVRRSLTQADPYR